MIDFIAHLTRQAAVSRATFGPDPRTEGILKHIESEIEEVRAARADDDLDELVKEWADIAILGLDGLLRAVREQLEVDRFHGKPLPVAHDRVAIFAWEAIRGKQAKNELRNWPDWRSMSTDAPIEHDRENGVQ